MRHNKLCRQAQTFGGEVMQWESIVLTVKTDMVKLTEKELRIVRNYFRMLSVNVSDAAI